jgi:hypothetical protein
VLAIAIGIQIRIAQVIAGGQASTLALEGSTEDILADFTKKTGVKTKLVAVPEDKLRLHLALRAHRLSAARREPSG